MGSIKGPTGSIGARGSWWYTGEGTPNGVSNPASGDLYLDTETGEYYARVGTSWMLAGDLTGPPGDKGDPGPNNLWTGTQEEYENLTPDPDMVYVIKGIGMGGPPGPPGPEGPPGPPGTTTWAGITDKPLLVSGSVNGVPTALTLWTGTQLQYDAIPTKDAATLYVIT